MDKPGLAILIGKAMDKKKGMPMHPDMEDTKDKESEKYDSEAEMDEQLQQISEELLDAIDKKDAGAVKDLLKEAFDCMSK